MRSCVLMAEAPALAAEAGLQSGLLPTAAKLSGMSTFMVSIIESRWATCQGEIQTCMSHLSVLLNSMQLLPLAFAASIEGAHQGTVVVKTRML